MPLVKIDLRPGVNVERSMLLQQGGYAQSHQANPQQSK